jgi:hypothetical protein
MARLADIDGPLGIECMSGFPFFFRPPGMGARVHLFFFSFLFWVHKDPT